MRTEQTLNGLKFVHTLRKKQLNYFHNIIRAGEDFYLNLMDAPFIPTWSRVKVIPDFLERLRMQLMMIINFICNTC